MSDLCLIAATSKNGVIGNAGKIPWTLPEDMRYFAQTTFGYPTIMGRKTYESIGRALPGRPAIVVSSTLRELPDATVVSNVELAIEFAKTYATDKVFVIGGEALYRHCLDYAQFVYLTVINRHFEGDTLFPHIDDGLFDGPGWVIDYSRPQSKYDFKLGHVSYRFDVYRRR